MVTDVERRVSKIGEAERGDHIPHAEETDLRVRLDDLVAAGPANAVGLNPMAEIERRRRAPAEPDDVDDAIAGGPGGAQVIVSFVDPRELAHAEDAADHFADEIESRADALEIKIVCPGARVVRLMEANHVRVRIRRIIAVFSGVPRSVECVQRHERVPLVARKICLRRNPFRTEYTIGPKFTRPGPGLPTYFEEVVPMSIVDDLVANLVERNALKLSGSLTIALVDGGVIIKGTLASTLRDQNKDRDILHVDIPVDANVRVGEFVVPVPTIP